MTHLFVHVQFLWTTELKLGTSVEVCAHDTIFEDLLTLLVHVFFEPWNECRIVCT